MLTLQAELQPQSIQQPPALMPQRQLYIAARDCTTQKDLIDLVEGRRLASFLPQEMTGCHLVVGEDKQLISSWEHGQDQCPMLCCMLAKHLVADPSTRRVNLADSSSYEFIIEYLRSRLGMFLILLTNTLSVTYVWEKLDIIPCLGNINYEKHEP